MIIDQDIKRKAAKFVATKKKLRWVIACVIVTDCDELEDVSVTLESCRGYGEAQIVDVTIVDGTA